MFRLDSNDALPLYRQLYDQVRASIHSGQLAADVRMPSVRELSTELSVSRNTVEGAYLELLAEGYLYSKPRSGYYVSELHQEPQALARPREVRPVQPAHAPEEKFRYDFHPARLDRKSFPVELWRKCLNDALRHDQAELVQYGTSQGDPGLRRNVQRYLEASRGVICDPEQIIITAGLQHSLEMVTHLVAGNPTVALEEPGYFMPRRVFERHGVKTVAIGVSAAGMDLEQLRQSGAGAAYVTPSHQLPTGCVMPISNRLALIDWARSGSHYIIEDDYDSELRYQGRPIPSLQGLWPNGDIIYCGTVSKILSPALRLSYLVLPQSLLAAYQVQYRDFFPSVSLLEQRTLARFMELGHWERHIRRMRTTYKRKHDILLQALERQFGARARVMGQGAGLHVVLQLVGPAPAEAEIIGRAAENRIRLFPFSGFCSGPSEGDRLILGFGGLALYQIEAAVALLRRCVD